MPATGFGVSELRVHSALLAGVPRAQLRLHLSRLYAERQTALLRDATADARAQRALDDKAARAAAVQARELRARRWAWWTGDLPVLQVLLVLLLITYRAWHTLPPLQLLWGALGDIGAAPWWMPARVHAALSHGQSTAKLLFYGAQAAAALLIGRGIVVLLRWLLPWHGPSRLAFVVYLMWLFRALGPLLWRAAWLLPLLGLNGAGLWYCRAAAWQRNAAASALTLGVTAYATLLL